MAWPHHRNTTRRSTIPPPVSAMPNCASQAVAVRRIFDQFDQVVVELRRRRSDLHLRAARLRYALGKV